MPRPTLIHKRLHPTQPSVPGHCLPGTSGQCSAGRHRLDYQLATPATAASAKSASVFKDQRFSDHAPLTVDYDLQL